MILDLHERVSRWDQLLINERLSTAERTLWGGQTADNVGLLQFVKVELDGVKRDLQALAVSKGTLS